MKNIDFRLLLVTDRQFLKNNQLDAFIQQCLFNGIKAVQLREKDLNSRVLLNLAKKLRKITKKYKSKLIINDRLDIALLSQADGLHSPENGIFPHQLSNSFSNLILGKSAHSLSAAVLAQKKGYDYIICGPIFKTPSKMKFGKPLGISELKIVCSTVKIPVFAIGGINSTRAKKCINAGAHGVGVIREIFNSKNLKKTIADFKNALGEL